MANEKKMDQVILGLLSHESLTGYEIKKRIDTRLKLFWSASYGSIYPTLNSLEKEKKVTKSGASKGGREKYIYTITEQGRDSLREWLEKPVVKDEFRYETLLKLFFGNEIGEEVTIEHIQNFQDKIQEQLPFLRASVEQLKEADEEKTHQYYMLTALFGKMIYETYEQWCEIAKQSLSETICNEK